MSITMRPLTLADADAVIDLDDYAFAVAPERNPRPAAWESYPWERSFGAEHPQMPGRLAGSYTSFPLTLGIPGPLGEVRACPVAGLSWVGVHPDLRRRGVLSAMLGHHFADLRERGETITALRASETGIYGRFGYGVASLDATFEIRKGTRLDLPARVAEAADAVRTTTLWGIDDDAVTDRLRTIDIACAAAVVGTVVPPAGLARADARDIPAARPDREPLRAIVATRGGADVGYALYARHRADAQAEFETIADVARLQASGPEVAAALARRLVDLDLTSGSTFHSRGLDDPILWWCGGPRSVTVRLGDALWLRPVDLPAMLTARGYAGPVDVVLEIADAWAPWNTGRWRLTVGADGEARCEPTDAKPALHAEVTALGPLYLGLRSAAALAAQGLLSELRAGAVAALDAALGARPAPLAGLPF